MIRAKLAGGGPLKMCDTINVYPDRTGTYDEYVPIYQQGWYRRTGEYPNFIYKWEAKE